MVFKKIRKVNPQFVQHSSKQLKIKEDAIVIEDSLLALAGRNFQIQKFVTDELFKMNDYISTYLRGDTGNTENGPSCEELKKCVLNFRFIFVLT